MLIGVCGGLGRYFDLNPTVFRVGFVVLTLLGGAGVLVYLAAALVMPAEGKERSRRNALKHGLTGEGVALPDEDVVLKSSPHMQSRNQK